MRKKWTLVTGASGFIGSTLVRRLCERGELVRAFVRPGANLDVFAGLSPERFQLAYGDVRVEHTVFRALASCHRLFHVATPFRFWSRRPSELIEPAVEGTRNVLGAAELRGIERIVVTSSSGVLGTTTSDEPMDETHENNLSDPELYIRAKIEADRVVGERIAAGQPIVSVLPSGVFGPGDRRPTPNGRAVLDYLKLSAGRRIPATHGGICVADVEDVAEGHVLAMERGRLGERYILGGENVTFRELFELMHELTGLARPGRAPGPGLVQLAGALLELSARWTGKDPILTRKLARDFAFARVWVTSEKAERELGYTHRPARETLSRAIRWYLAHGRVPQNRARRVRLELRPV